MGSRSPLRSIDDALQGLSGSGHARQLLQDAEQQLQVLQLCADTSATRQTLVSRIEFLENVLSPIRNVPVEVLSIAFDFYLSDTIFTHATMKEKVRWFMHHVEQGPCILLRVCSRWRNICKAGFASYFASLVMSISDYVVFWPRRPSNQNMDGPMVRKCLGHYMELFAGGLFVLTMDRCGVRPAVIAGFQGLPCRDHSRDDFLSFYAPYCSELRAWDSGNHWSSPEAIAVAFMSLQPMHGWLHRLETLSLDFGDPSNGFESGSCWDLFAKNRLLAQAPKLHRLRLRRKAIHVLAARLARLTLPWQQIDDLQCQYDEPCNCLAALLSFPSLMSAILLRYVSQGPPATGTVITYAPDDHRQPQPRGAPWPGFYVKKPIRLTRLSRLSVFCKYGVHGRDDEEYPILAYLNNYPGEILDLLCAPALERLRVGFASDQAPGGYRPVTVIPTLISFFRRSECALVELFMFLHAQETEEDIIELFRTVPTLRKLTLGMSYGFHLSAEVLQALVASPARRSLLPSLRSLTLITDESPDPALLEGDLLADVIESRVGARQRSEGLLDDLEIFRFACQDSHQFTWCERTKERMRAWMRQGLKIGRAVVHLPTTFIDIRDEGHFFVDWQWLWVDTIDDYEY